MHLPQPGEKQLPNSISVAALFEAAHCLSPGLVTPTKWPEFRTIKMDISLELESTPGQTTSLIPSVNFQVRPDHLARHAFD